VFLTLPPNKLVVFAADDDELVLLRGAHGFGNGVLFMRPSDMRIKQNTNNELTEKMNELNVGNI
jgi:hypothetical protein